MQKFHNIYIGIFIVINSNFREKKVGTEKKNPVSQTDSEYSAYTLPLSKKEYNSTFR
jgi:hypothetical protein